MGWLTTYSPERRGAIRAIATGAATVATVRVAENIGGEALTNWIVSAQEVAEIEPRTHALDDRESWLVIESIAQHLIPPSQTTKLDIVHTPEGEPAVWFLAGDRSVPAGTPLQDHEAIKSFSVRLPHGEVRHFGVIASEKHGAWPDTFRACAYLEIDQNGHAVQGAPLHISYMGMESFGASAADILKAGNRLQVADPQRVEDFLDLALRSAAVYGVEDPSLAVGSHSLGVHSAMMTQACAMKRGIPSDVLSLEPYCGNDAAVHAVKHYGVSTKDFVQHTTQVRAFPPTAVALISTDADQELYGRELNLVTPTNLRDNVGDMVSDRHRWPWR